MSRCAIDDALIVALRAVPAGEAAKAAEIRAAVGCSAADLRTAVNRLRFRGMIEFDRLALRPSMREQEEEKTLPATPPHPGAASDPAAGGGRSEAPVPDPLERPTADAPGGDEAHPPCTGERPAGEAKRPLPPPPAETTGDVLLAEMLDYCARTGTARSLFGLRATGSPVLHNRLAGRAPRPETIAKVRAFMADHPDGVTWDTVSREEVPAAAEAHDAAAGAGAVSPEAAPAVPAAPAPAPAPRAEPPPVPFATEAAQLFERPTGGGERIPAHMPRVRRRTRIPLPAGSRPTVELIQSLCAETPEDLMASVRARHPQLWRRAIALGRQRRTSPAAALYSALEAGLDQREQETAHGDA